MYKLIKQGFKKNGFWFVLIPFFIYSATVFAGITGKIAGTITDAKTGKPLAGANILIVGTSMGAAADVNGDYFIINIPPGTYTVEARMMGYETVRKTGILVSIDHTTPLDFSLAPTIIKGQVVTVVAGKEIMQKDVSSTRIVSRAAEVRNTPLVTKMEEYINLQAGVEDMQIRGGDLSQTAFMMDGLTLVDDRANTPLTLPNISSIKQIELIKGGFNAEYGNVRSGVVNVVTKEGSPTEYHGSINFRLSPPHLKHGGPSLYDPDNYYLRPYLDPEVCWEGTKNGGWDKETQRQNKSFIGWNAVSANLLADKDPSNDLTPEEARNLFIWRHAAKGAGELIPKGYKGPYHEGRYGNKPDWNLDLGVGGPVPVIGKYLGKLSFFFSYRTNWEMFGLPAVRDYYKENNAQLKLTSRISPSMKLSFIGMSGKINSVANTYYQPNGPDDYVKSGEDIFWSDRGWPDPQSFIYFPSSQTPFDIYMGMEGISFVHVLSPKVFYSLRLTHIHRRNSNNASPLRDTTTIRYFGKTPVDEAPYGYWEKNGTEINIDNTVYSGYGDARDWSKVNTINFKGDLTMQLNKYNEVKLGLVANYDDIYIHYGAVGYVIAGDQFMAESEDRPIRAGAYIQDKIEFKGMIANVGVRLDYSDPNTDWYDADRYSDYFSAKYRGIATKFLPKKRAKTHLKVSPRLGISHPITATSKLYFNYGHFYSMAPSRDLYTIRYPSLASPSAGFWGNPSADMPKTVAYELGLEQSIGNLFLLHLSGYYKDVTDQTGRVRYTNYDGSVDYETIQNNNYQDIRGFEFRLEKKFGRWITGWVNYTYMVTTSGYTGREHYFQDKIMQKIYGLHNPYQERPLARPILRANVWLSIPKGWGPTIGGIKPLADSHLSFLFSWKAGEWMTWDPLHTYKLVDNLQWKPYYNLDLQLRKELTIGGNKVSVFMDIFNVLNTKHLDELGFSDDQDRKDYFYSLHLPMYKGEKYKAAGFIPGNDKPGDIKSKDKPYIDMPNRKFLTFLDLRSISFGLRFDF